MKRDVMRGRPLTAAEERLLVWAKLHREPDQGIGWRAVFRGWIGMLENGSRKSQDHAAVCLWRVHDLVIQGISMSAAVIDVVRDNE